jgi:transposase, IS30 family
VKLRCSLGHWEGDTIRFPIEQKGCVTTLVERKSRFLCLRKNERKSAPRIIEQIFNVIKSSPRKIWDSITFDQGPEFMSYRLIERKTNCKIFFCNPSSPWQRGSNENTNGRLRRYLPKKHHIDETSQEDLDRIASLINNTPRKCLGYQTPREVFIQCWKTFCRTAL